MRVFRVRLTVRWAAAAGLILASGRSDTRAEPPIAGIASQAIESQGLKDKAPITFRDMSAYAALLKRAREAKPADLAGLARRDVGFGDLWDHPDDYRGALIELRGVCRRTYSSESKLGAGGRLHEVWITVPESDPNPFACIAETLPEGFPIDAAGSEPVVFRGYFLKLVAYDATAVRRGAPLLIGRLERVVGDKPVDRNRSAEPVLPRRLSCWVGTLSPTQEPVHATPQRPQPRTRLATTPPAAVHQWPVHLRLLRT